MCIQVSGLDRMQHYGTALLQHRALTHSVAMTCMLTLRFKIHDLKPLHTSVCTPRLGSSCASLAFRLATLHVQLWLPLYFCFSHADEAVRGCYVQWHLMPV